MRDYMRERLATFMGTLVDLEHAAFDEGYNVLQARISIGSGGLFGRGYLEGTQSQLGFLRITQSDFIFSAAAEELGFIGAAVLFCLFVMLLFRVTRAADMSRDDFGRLLTFGVAAMILFAAVANLGANLTLLPVTGIPLPFISYGRTSLLTNLAALGHRPERAAVPPQVPLLARLRCATADSCARECVVTLSQSQTQRPPGMNIGVHGREGLCALWTGSTATTQSYT